MKTCLFYHSNAISALIQKEMQCKNGLCYPFDANIFNWNLTHYNSIYFSTKLCSQFSPDKIAATYLPRYLVLSPQDVLAHSYIHTYTHTHTLTIIVNQQGDELISYERSSTTFSSSSCAAAPEAQLSQDKMKQKNAKLDKNSFYAQRRRTDDYKHCYRCGS